jgi:subtilase family serine protease
LIFSPSASQKAALQTLIAQQQDPSSPKFHRWITPEQYADSFGMTTDDLNKVTSWLKAQGFTVDRVSRSRTKVSFSGSVSRFESVFQTEFHQYTVNGEKHFANATELSVPSALAGTVLGFRNLDDFRLKPRNVRPRFTSDVSGNTFLAPADVATIYNIKPLYDVAFDGTGQRIAVVGQTAINVNDVAAFRSASGLSVNPPQILLMPGSGASFTSTNDVPEADLDVEWSGAIAKNASIIYVFTGNAANFTVIDAFEYSIDNNLAPVVSISYGACEALNGPTFITSLQSLMQQATTQGQTVSSAVGDVGAADCDAPTATVATHGLAVDVPGAIPEVTGIGGTTFTGDDNHNPTYWNPTNNVDGGSALQHIPETTWNDGPGSATGGGVSSVIAKPSFQTALTPADGHRDVPDIALSASPDHDPYLFCTNGGCVNGFRSGSGGLAAVGGTSVGAPVFAGILALINQATESSAGLGTVNPVLYDLAVSTPNAFHDITTGDNKVPCQQGSTDCPTSAPFVIGHSAKVGYDLVTGLGSLNVDNLVTNWPGFTLDAFFGLAASPSPVTITSAGKSGTSTVTVSSETGFAGTINLTCQVLNTVAEMGCTVSPTSVALSGTTTSATTTLHVSTTAPHAVTTNSNATMAWLAVGGTSLLGSVVLGASMRRRSGMLLGLLFICIALSSISCGGGSNNNKNNGGGLGNTTDPGTAAGSYVVTVTGTSGSISHSVNVTITVH